MVCPRCITAVRAILVSMGFMVESISLGEATINESLSDGQLRLLADKLQDEGFELLNDPRSCLVEQIKYSSPAHLTSQFKQQTGMSPKAVRELKTKNRLHLDEI